MNSLEEVFCTHGLSHLTSKFLSMGYSMQLLHDYLEDKTVAYIVTDLKLLVSDAGKLNQYYLFCL